MAKATNETQRQESRGVLSVVLMLLLAGVFTILFAAGNIKEEAQGATGDESRPPISETR